MEFNIDFNDASKCWRENKKYKGNGYFEYICSYIHTNGKRCKNNIYSNITYNPYAYNDFEKFEKNYNHPNKNIFCKKHLNHLIIVK